MEDNIVIALARTEARGRNGWFRAVKAAVYSYRDELVILSITSRVEVYPGPVFLEMAVEDARALGQALLDAANTYTKNTEEGG